MVLLASAEPLRTMLASRLLFTMENLKEYVLRNHLMVVTGCGPVRSSPPTPLQPQTEAGVLYLLRERLAEFDAGIR